MFQAKLPDDAPSSFEYRCKTCKLPALATWTLLLTSLVGSASRAVAQDDGQDKTGDSHSRLLNYLEELNLPQWRLESQLGLLKRESRPIERRQLAEQLQRHLKRSEKGMSFRLSPSAAQEFRELATEFPDLNQVPLRLALLETDYESVFPNDLAAWQKSRDSQTRDPASRELSRLVAEVKQIQAQLEADWQASRLESTESERLYDFDQAYFQTVYWEGRLALTSAVANPSEKNSQAELCCQKMYLALGIDESIELIENVERSRWSNPRQVQALFAIAAAQTLKGDEAVAQRWFDYLNRNSNEPPFDQADAWRFKALVYHDRLDDAYEFYQAKMVSATSRVARLRLEESAIEAVEASERIEPAWSIRLAFRITANALAAQDTVGVERLPDSIRQTVADNSPVLAQWWDAFAAVQEYRRSNDPNHLDIAQVKSQEALTSAEKENLAPELLVGLQFLHAEICIWQRDWGAAMPFVEQVSQQAENFDRRLYELARGLRIRCLIGRAGQDPRGVPAALQGLDEYARDFPASQVSINVPFERLQLSLSVLSPDEALSVVRRRLLNETTDWQLRFLAIEQLSRKLMSARGQDPESTQPLVDEAIGYWSSLLRSVDAPGVFKLRSSILLQNILLNSGFPAQPGSDLAHTHVGLVQGAIERALITYSVEVPERSALAIESQLMLMNGAMNRGEWAVAAAQARRVIDLADHHSLLREPAHVVLAQSLERTLAASTEPGGDSRQLAALKEQLMANYRDWISRRDPSQPNSRNLQIAALKLARLWMDAGQYGEANRLCVPILNEIEGEQEALSTIGQIQLGLGKMEEAHGTFRRLVEGTELGTEPWLAGKWGIVRSLRNRQPELAKQVAAQVNELVPDLSELWKTRFAEALR